MSTHRKRSLLLSFVDVALHRSPGVRYLLRDAVVKAIFDFTRNVFLSSGIMLAARQLLSGLWGIEQQQPLLTIIRLCAWFLLFIGIALYGLNLTYGLRTVLRLTRRLDPTLRMFVLLVGYGVYATAASTLLTALIFFPKGQV